MANEITKSVALAVSKGGAAIASGTKSETQDMTGGDVYTGTQTIDTTAGALAWGECDTPCGSLAIANNSTADTVTLTATTIILRPGDVCLFQPGTSTIDATASADGCPIQVWACDV